MVGLIRTNFLKRFESSVYAFERSCDRLMRKLMAFIAKNNATPQEERRFERWIDQHDTLLEYSRTRQLELWRDDVVEEEDEDEDVVPAGAARRCSALDRDEYDVNEIIQETFLDLDQLASFLEEARRFEPKHDDKLKKLVRMLKSKEMSGRKVLIFTEFADTARYLRKHLKTRDRRGRADRQRHQGGPRRGPPPLFPLLQRIVVA